MRKDQKEGSLSPGRREGRQKEVKNLKEEKVEMGPSREAMDAR